MFPVLNLDKAKIEIEDKQTRNHQGKSYLYDFNEGEFILKNGKLVEVEGKEGVKIWIEKILLTDEFVYEIYREDGNDEYGTTIRKLVIGRKVPQLLLLSELKRIIEEKLKQNIEIDRIEHFKIEQEITTLTIYFTVVLKSGESFIQEVSF